MALDVFSATGAARRGSGSGRARSRSGGTPPASSGCQRVRDRGASRAPDAGPLARSPRLSAPDLPFQTPRVTDDLIEVTLAVAAVLDRCRIPYTVGGSLASSLSGEPRASLGADVVV